MMSYQQAAALFGAMQAREKHAHKVVLLRMAQDFRREVIRGITLQAPGGIPFAPLKASTLAARKAKGFGGTKILIVTAQLRNSVTVAMPDENTAFVGVLKTAMRKDGTPGANIAAVHEFGTTKAGKSKRIVIPRRSFLVNTYKAWQPKARENFSRVFGDYLLTGKQREKL